MIATVRYLLERYFPGWKSWDEEAYIGISDGKWNMYWSHERIEGSVSPWYLYDMAFAIVFQRLKAKGIFNSLHPDYQKERDRIKALWAQEPV